jgi:hypothetical protein
MPTQTEQKGGEDSLIVHDAEAIAPDDVWAIG